MVGLAGMGNSWGVVMVIFDSYLVYVNVVWFIRYYGKR